MKVVFLHPGAPPEYLDPLLSFLRDDDPRPAREQFHERYVYGGWRPLDGCTLEGINMVYPGDPPFQPWASILFRDETIFVYMGDFVGIVQKDGSFECARLD